MGLRLSNCLTALVVPALLASCKSVTTDNAPYDPVVERYIGTWTAVRMANAPLPWRSGSTTPYTEVSAIALSVGQFQFTLSETASQYDAGASAPSSVGCVTSRRIRASETELTGTDVVSALLICPLSNAVLTFTAVGDSLAVVYRGQRVMFVR